MKITTPNEINETVKSFYESIVKDGKTVFLDLKSEPDAVELYCTENVEKKIKRDGGKVQYGWQIMITEPVFIEAQFHVVWVDKDNDMHDITPRQDKDTGKILFLPDSNLKYENKQINNIRKALVKDKMVDDFIETSDRYFEATNRGDLALKHGMITSNDVTPEHAREIEILQMEMARLWMCIDSKYS